MKAMTKSKAIAILLSLTMVFTMMPMMPGTAYAASQMSTEPDEAPAEQEAEQPAEATHEHNWADGEEIAPTCTEPGSITYECECGETKTEEIPAQGHEWGKDNGVDPVTCEVCGEVKPEAAPKMQKKGGEKAGDDAILSMTSENGWPAEQDTTYVMAEAKEKRYRIDYKRKSPQNKVLVVETLDFGSTYTNLPTDGDEIIAEAKALDDHRFAVRLKNVGNDMGSYFTFSIKHVALTAAEAATLIDGYNSGGADTRLAVKEYNLDPEAPLETVLTVNDDEGCAKKVTCWEGRPYYKNYGENEHPIDIKNPETDLYKVDVTPLSTSDAPMTNEMLDRIGHYNSNAGYDLRGRTVGEPRIRLPEAYQKTDKLDGSLVEIEKIRLYAPSNKMKLRVVTNTQPGHEARGQGRVLVPSDFTEQWGGWVIDKGQDGKGYLDQNKKVTITNPDGTTSEESARYFDVTPPSRWFNRGTVGLNEFLGGMVTHWNLIDANDQLAAGTKYIVPEGMVVYYRLPGDTTARQAKFPGPEIRTYKVSTRSNPFRIIGESRYWQYKYKRYWDQGADTEHNVAVGSIQRDEVFYRFGNEGYLTKESNSDWMRQYLPAELGTVTQTFTFPYQLQPARMNLEGYCRSPIYPSLPGSELASIKYTCHGSTETHEVDSAVIDNINRVLSTPSDFKALGAVSFDKDVHVKTLTITWTRLANTTWRLPQVGFQSNDEGTSTECVKFTYRVNDWKDETEEEKLDLSVAANKWVQVKFEENFSSTQTSPDCRPPVVNPPGNSERTGMGRQEQAFWFRLVPPVCPDLIVKGNSRDEPWIHQELDNGNTIIGQLGFEVDDYGQRRDTILNPTIQLGLTWENELGMGSSFGTGAHEKCGLDGIELSDMLFFLNGSFKAGTKLFNTKENKGWTFTYDVFNGETKKTYQKTYTVKAEDIGQTVNLLEANEYFTSLSLSYDGAADVSHVSENDTEKVKWLMSDIGVRRLDTNPRDGKPISVSKDFCATVLSLVTKANFEDCTCSDHKHCSKTDHASHLGTAKWQKAKFVYDRHWAFIPYIVVYKTRKGSVNVTGSLETTALQSIRQGDSTTASFNFKEACSTFAPLWSPTSYVESGNVFTDYRDGRHVSVYPWGEIHEAVYIELTDPQFVPDLTKTTFCGQSCDPAKGKVVSDTVVTADGKTFLKLTLAKGVTRRSVMTGSIYEDPKNVKENLKLAFKSLPSTSKGRHNPVGDIYFDVAGLLDHYRAGDKDSEGNPITTGYDRERTKYVFSGAVDDPYAGTADALSPWTAEGIADKKLFKYDGSGFKVDVDVEQAVGASLAPGKDYGNYATGTTQPRTLTFYPGEENDLNALMSLTGPSPNDDVLYDIESYVTLPRIGTDIEWSEYETQNGEPVLVDQEPQANEELSLYLREAANIILNDGKLDCTITYTTGTPGIGATYVTADKITDWRAVTGLKVYVKECPPENNLEVRLNLECDAKGNTNVLTAYGGGEYRYKETEDGRFKTPRKLHLCAWEYGNDANMLTLETTGYEGVYDGDSHKGSVTASDTEGTTIEYSTDGGKTWSEEEPSITDVGETTVTVRATNPNYNNKPMATYTLKVTPAPLTIKTASASKKYDGKPLTKTDGYTIDGLVKNETVAFAVTGTQTEVGESDNTYELDWETSTAKKGNYEITEELGTLEVTKNDTEIILTAASDKRVYNGQPLTNDGVTAKGLPEGFTVKATMTKESTVTDVGTQDNVIGKYEILIASNKKAPGDVVTDNFTNVKKEKGLLEVTPAQLTIETASATKEYDSTPLTKTDDYVFKGLMGKETASFEVTGSQTDVGKSDNTYKITWDGTAKEGNYEVIEELGTLEITAITATVTVVITGKTDSVVYDGKEHSVEGYDFMINGSDVYTEDDFTFSGKAEARGTEVALYPMGLTAEQFTNINDNFTNVNFLVSDGQLDITPIQEVLPDEEDPEDDSKVEDDTEDKSKGSGNGSGTRTGDNSLMTLCIILMLMAIALVGVVVIRRRKA